MAFGFGHGFTRGGGSSGGPAFSVDFTTGALPSAFTFSRSSSGSAYGSNAQLYWPENLILQSGDVGNAAWAKNVASATSNSTAAPDGTITAALVNMQASGSYVQNAVAGIVSVSTFSIYAKAGSTQYVQLANSGDANMYANFDVSGGTAGTKGSAATSTITNVGNGWYRCVVTFTPGTFGAGWRVYAAASNSAGNGSTVASGTLYLWGAQLQAGANVSTYIPTTASAVYGPRFDYNPDPATYVSQNLLLQSNTFTDATWVKTLGGATASAPVITGAYATGPDGVAGSASRMQMSLNGATGSGDQSILRQTVNTIPSTVITTTSVWVRSTDGTSSYNMILFGSPSASTPITVTGTWQRVTYTGSGPNANFSLMLRGGQVPANSNTADILMYGFQLEQRSSAGTYVATTTAAVTNATPRGLLVEESRTNLCLQSGNIADAAWSVTRATAAANQTTAPDGTVTAGKLTEDATATNSHLMNNTVALTIVNATSYTVSCYAKAAGRTWIQLVPSFSSGSAYFDIANGVVGTVANGTATIQNVGNGWFKCSLSFTSTAISGFTFIQLASGDGSNTYSGDGTSGAYIWGIQCEQGAFTTSYIPTTTVAVTRGVDSCLTTSIGSWYNTAAGSYIVGFDCASSVPNMAFSSIDTAGTNGLLTWKQSGTFNAQAFYDTNSTSSLGAIPVNTPSKLGSVYDGGVSNSGSLNGAAVSAATVQAAITAPDRLVLGNRGQGDFPITGHISSFSYYNYRMANSALLAATAWPIPAAAYSLNFLNTSTLDPSLTFTRNTTGTNYNSSGTLVTAAINAARFDYNPDPATYVSQNLLTWSQDCTNAVWSKTTVTVTGNATTAPDGTGTASSLVSQAPGARVQQAFSNAAQTAYTYSLYVKAGPQTGSPPQVTMLLFDVTASSTIANCGVNLSTGAILGGSPTVTNAGNGWWRISITGTPAASNHALQVYCYAGQSTSTVGDTVYVWGGQLEQRSSVGAYQPTTSAAITNATPRGLLVEESRTNLCLQSETFDNASWSKNVLTVTANQTTAPDGTSNADLIANSATTLDTPVAFQAITVTAAAYTNTVYAKANAANFLTMGTFDGTTVIFSGFNLSTGVVDVTGAGHTCTIQNVGNGWYRCSVTYTYPSTTGRTYAGVYHTSNTITYTPSGIGADSIYVWGAQTELGAFATSYIPTTTVAVARGADTCSNSSITSWFNRAQGTFVANADVMSIGGGNYAICAFSAGASYATGNGFLMRTSSASVLVGGNGSGVISSGISVNTVFKSAGLYQGTTETVCLNGATPVTSSANDFTGIGTTTFLIGAITTGNTQQYNGHIRSLTYYASALYPAQLQSLTT